MTMLEEQSTSKEANIRKFKTGLDKLISTNEMVKQMEQELSKLAPVLEQSAKDVAELLIQIDREQAEATQVGGGFLLRSP